MNAIHSTASRAFNRRDLFGRLTSPSDLAAVILTASQAFPDAKIARDEDAGTVTVTHPDGREVFRAIAKGAPTRDPWIVVYSRAFYDSETSAPRASKPGKPPQRVNGHECRIVVKAGTDGRSNGQRAVSIDGGRRIVPLELACLAAGPDRWLRDVQARCLDCRKPVALGLMTVELCPACYDKAGEENAAQDA